MSGGDGERAVVDGEIAIDGSMGGRAVEGSLDWWTDLLLERGIAGERSSSVRRDSLSDGNIFL